MGKINSEFTLLKTESYKKLGFEFLDSYEVDGNPLSIRRESIDEMLFKEILMYECYQPDLWFNRNLRERYRLENVKNILDVGANVGIASRYFASLYPEANIFSFEAEGDNYELLKRNTSNYPQINAYHVAIWNHNNGVYINNRNDIIGNSGKANPAKYNVDEKEQPDEKLINSMTLSEFIEQTKLETIDILKIDIQGAEVEAFEDSNIWLPRTRLMFIEIHDLFKPGCSKKVFESLFKYGNFKFIGSPNREILAFLREDEL